jgi:hypothetical protein
MTQQEPTTPEQHPGVLPRYRDIYQSCADAVVEQFVERFSQVFAQIDDFMLGLAEKAGTNAERNHCFEVMHELLLTQVQIERSFSNELSRGFNLFAEGDPDYLSGADREELADKLSLVEKDDYEVSLAFETMRHSANNQYAEPLVMLDHRLAAMSGGVKLGEYHPAIPASPAQVSGALKAALGALDVQINHDVRLAMIEEFAQKVLYASSDIYANFNKKLIEAGILPNLSLEAIGYRPAESVYVRGAAQSQPVEEKPEPQAAEPANEAEEEESSMDREIFNSIQEILARRHASSGADRKSVV